MSLKDAGNMYDRDYGRLGRIGLVTPQANPTAEPEMQLLLPAGVSLLSARCTSKGEPRERFLNYLTRLDEPLASFDTLALDAVAFACTASSYLVDPGDEQRKISALQAQFGYPVVTAAGAIHQALQFLGAKSLAIACPYPEWLFEQAVAFWEGRGYRVLSAISIQADMEDTRAIYELSGAAAAEQIGRTFAGLNADVVLITGTGMPGLQAVVDIQRMTGKPALNSNLCLAWACLQAANIPGGERQPSREFPLLGGWADGIRKL